jgi:hypothetical protein
MKAESDLQEKIKPLGSQATQIPENVQEQAGDQSTQPVLEDGEPSSQQDQNNEDQQPGGWLSSLTNAIASIFPGQSTPELQKETEEPVTESATETVQGNVVEPIEESELPQSENEEVVEEIKEPQEPSNKPGSGPSLPHESGLFPPATSVQDLFRPSQLPGSQFPLDLALAQEFGSSVCIYKDRIYMSAEQIPRSDPCDFCFCFRGDVICLQQSCPPPVLNCIEEPIAGFCCPRYECSVPKSNATNAKAPRPQFVTTTTTTTPSTTETGEGCNINGVFYAVGEVIGPASGPCMRCK